MATYGHEGGYGFNEDQRGGHHPEVSQDATFNEQWNHVMSGLDRAVAWVKENKPLLRKGFSFYLNRETGIRISMGFMFKDDSDLQAIRDLFRGKKATRTVTQDGNERFLVLDAGLSFEWEIFHARNREQKVTEVCL